MDKCVLTYVGYKFQLKRTILPDNATNKNVTYSSDNPSVASVIDVGPYAGQVTGWRVGTATITCEAKDGSGVRAQCIVTVLPMLQAPRGDGPALQALTAQDVVNIILMMTVVPFVFNIIMRSGDPLLPDEQIWEAYSNFIDSAARIGMGMGDVIEGVIAWGLIVVPNIFGLNGFGQEPGGTSEPIFGPEVIGALTGLLVVGGGILLTIFSGGTVAIPIMLIKLVLGAVGGYYTTLIGDFLFGWLP